VHLGCFGTDEIASCGWEFEKIESSFGRIVSHFQGVIVYEVFDP
jgi:hypothetical protein